MVTVCDHDWIEEYGFDVCGKCKAYYYHNIGEPDDYYDDMEVSDDPWGV